MNAPFPFALAARLVRDPKKATPDEIREIVHYARYTYDLAMQLNWQLGSRDQDVLRLTHENQFMLRLINQKENAK